MNRLAREGMRFTSGYSPGPLCTPTRRSIQNGMTPARQRGTEFKSEWVPAEHLTMARALKQADPAYVCAHFGKWGEDMISSPEQCGYDASDGMTTNGTGGAGGDRFADAVKDDPKLITTLTKRATDFMAAQVKAQRPFYLQLSHYAVHRQVQASKATNDKYLAQGKPRVSSRPRSRAMMEDLNTGLTQLLDEVDRLGIAGSTYIVFTADNGGNRTYAGTDTSLPLNNHPLRMGKQSLYEGGIRVPFIVRGPGVKPGSVSHEPVAGFDLLPTFYDLAGGKTPLPLDIDGGSFRAPLENAGEGKVQRSLPGLVFHRPHHAAAAAFHYPRRRSETRGELENRRQGTVRPLQGHRRSEQPRPHDAGKDDGAFRRAVRLPEVRERRDPRRSAGSTEEESEEVILNS